MFTMQILISVSRVISTHRIGMLTYILHRYMIVHCNKDCKVDNSNCLADKEWESEGFSKGIKVARIPPT